MKIFKSIGKYGKYDFSNYKVSKNGNVVNNKNKLKKLGKDENGYIIISLWCKIFKKPVKTRMHRIVAFVYISNDDPDNKKEINHIDKDRAHNHYLNLEWVTSQENIAHSHGKMVKMIDVNTNKVLKIFRTIKDAMRHLKACGSSAIADVCNGKWKTYKGYKWEWVGKDEIIDLPIITVTIKKKKKLNSDEIVEV
jgi:hypothetical protein